MKYFSKKIFTMRQVVSLLTVVFLGVSVIAYAVTVDFTPGSTISSTAVENAINQNRAVAACSAEVQSVALATAANIQSVSITVPGPGTIIVSGSGYFSFNNTSALAWQSAISISDTSGTINQAARSFWGGPAGMPSDGIFSYFAPFYQQHAFTVAGAGTYIYYLVGWKNTTEGLSASEFKICAAFSPN